MNTHLETFQVILPVETLTPLLTNFQKTLAQECSLNFEKTNNKIRTMQFKNKSEKTDEVIACHWRRFPHSCQFYTDFIETYCVIGKSHLTSAIQLVLKFLPQLSQTYLSFSKEQKNESSEFNQQSPVSFDVFLGYMPNFNKDSRDWDIIESIANIFVSETVLFLLASCKSDPDCLDAGTITLIREFAFGFFKPVSPRKICQNLWNYFQNKIRQNWSYVLGQLSVNHLDSVLKRFFSAIDPKKKIKMEQIIPYYQSIKKIRFTNVNDETISKALTMHIKMMKSYKKVQYRLVQLKALYNIISQLDFSSGSHQHLFSVVEYLYQLIAKSSKHAQLKPICYKLMTSILIRSSEIFYTDTFPSFFDSKILSRTKIERKRDYCLSSFIIFLRGCFQKKFTWIAKLKAKKPNIYLQKLEKKVFEQEIKCLSKARIAGDDSEKQIKKIMSVLFNEKSPIDFNSFPVKLSILLGLIGSRFLNLYWKQAIPNLLKRSNSVGQYLCAIRSFRILSTPKLHQFNKEKGFEENDYEGLKQNIGNIVQTLMIQCDSRVGVSVLGRNKMILWFTSPNPDRFIVANKTRELWQRWHDVYQEIKHKKQRHVMYQKEVFETVQKWRETVKKDVLGEDISKDNFAVKTLVNGDFTSIFRNNGKCFLKNLHDQKNQHLWGDLYKELVMILPYVMSVLEESYQELQIVRNLLKNLCHPDEELATLCSHFLQWIFAEKPQVRLLVLENLLLLSVNPHFQNDHSLMTVLMHIENFLGIFENLLIAEQNTEKVSDGEHLQEEIFKNADAVAFVNLCHPIAIIRGISLSILKKSHAIQKIFSPLTCISVWDLIDRNQTYIEDRVRSAYLLYLNCGFMPDTEQYGAGILPSITLKNLAYSSFHLLWTVALSEIGKLCIENERIAVITLVKPMIYRRIRAILSVSVSQIPDTIFVHLCFLFALLLSLVGFKLTKNPDTISLQESEEVSIKEKEDETNEEKKEELSDLTANEKKLSQNFEKIGVDQENSVLPQYEMKDEAFDGENLPFSTRFFREKVDMLSLLSEGNTNKEIVHLGKVVESRDQIRKILPDLWKHMLDSDVRKRRFVVLVTGCTHISNARSVIKRLKAWIKTIPNLTNKNKQSELMQVYAQISSIVVVLSQNPNLYMAVLEEKKVCSTLTNFISDEERFLREWINIVITKNTTVQKKQPSAPLPLFNDENDLGSFLSHLLNYCVIANNFGNLLLKIQSQTAQKSRSVQEIHQYWIQESRLQTFRFLKTCSGHSGNEPVLLFQILDQETIRISGKIKELELAKKTEDKLRAIIVAIQTSAHSAVEKMLKIGKLFTGDIDKETKEWFMVSERKGHSMLKTLLAFHFGELLRLYILYSYKGKKEESNNFFVPLCDFIIEFFPDTSTFSQNLELFNLLFSHFHVQNPNEEPKVVNQKQPIRQLLTKTKSRAKFKSNKSTLQTLSEFEFMSSDSSPDESEISHSINAEFTDSMTTTSTSFGMGKNMNQFGNLDLIDSIPNTNTNTNNNNNNNNLEDSDSEDNKSNKDETLDNQPVTPLLQKK
eukprot:Anaeramoba_ignava/a607660_42.p1 GENE.a607660_42~~a607660_42.p1  ORF type:complete len:1540 (-),score=382.39 a607660_42:44-4663(-)